MIKKKTIIIAAAVLVLCFFTYLAYRQASVLQRSPQVLMNKYYQLRDSNPEAAKTALIVLLKQDQDHVPALIELSSLYIKDHNERAALPLIRRLHQLFPENNQYAFQLASIYYNLGDWDKARPLLETIKDKKDDEFKISAITTLIKMDSYLPRIDRIPVTPRLVATMDTSYMGIIYILLNRYYSIQEESPQDAENLLLLLSILSPKNPQIHQEVGYLLLRKGQDKKALPHLLYAYQFNPSPRLALQLGYVFVNLGEIKSAAPFFLAASAAHDAEIKSAAIRGYEFTQIVAPITPKLTLTAGASAVQPLPIEIALLNTYYELRKTNKLAAWNLIQKIVQQYPNNINALKEAGYLAMEMQELLKAINFFTSAFNLTYQSDLAMQLGYLYDQVTDKYLAYQYFKRATRSEDKELALRAQNAMTNLAGQQTKAFPKPYFAEIFFDPFSQSRFGLTVRPLMARFGIERNDNLQSKTYLVFRQTDDNKSQNLGQLPEIFEDNVRIIGAGLQITPIRNIPLIAFVEAGGAYDLIDRGRNRWRGDLRGGLMYYNEFGALPAYYDAAKLSREYYSFVYADAIYFSRYNNNVISSLLTHQGIRLLQYKSSMLNLYIAGRVLADTNRDFFNNIAEIGPGISFIPSNRFRVQLRFEHIRGVYLPAGGSVNPYDKYYNNNIVQLLYYVKL